MDAATILERFLNSPYVTRRGLDSVVLGHKFVTSISMAALELNPAEAIKESMYVIRNELEKYLDDLDRAMYWVVNE